MRPVVQADDAPEELSKAEQVRRTIERATQELAEQLKAGNSEQLNAFLLAMSRFHRYSFGNVLLIICQRPDSTRVAGFHTWRSLGRTVKRGEKGIAIFAPMMVRTTEEPSSGEPADGEATSIRRLRFRVVHVFDVSQTEGEPLPQLSRIGGDPGLALDRLEAAVRAAGIRLETSDSLGGAEGVSKGGEIVLRGGLSAAERFSVLAHEWAHELLHQGESEHRPDKTVRETEAEAVAFIVAQSMGLECGNASADYIRLYQGHAQTLAASLDRIQKAACIIIEAIEADPSKKSHGASTDAVRRAGVAAALQRRR